MQFNAVSNVFLPWLGAWGYTTFSYLGPLATPLQGCHTISPSRLTGDTCAIILASHKSFFVVLSLITFCSTAVHDMMIYGIVVSHSLLFANERSLSCETNANIVNYVRRSSLFGPIMSSRPGAGIMWGEALQGGPGGPQNFGWVGAPQWVSEWVSEQFLNGTSAQYRLYSAIQIKS